MTKKRSEPIASVVGSPAVSGVIAMLLTGLDSCVTCTRGFAANVTTPSLRLNVPALAASAGWSSLMRFDAARPKVLSPGFNQYSPTNVSQPCSLVRLATRRSRHCSNESSSPCELTQTSSVRRRDQARFDIETYSEYVMSAGRFKASLPGDSCEQHAGEYKNLSAPVRVPRQQTEPDIT